MSIKVYNSELGKEVEMESIGKVAYIGETFGFDELTNGKVYDVVGIDGGDMLRVLDDSCEDYLYSLKNPAPLDGSSVGGKWKLIADYTGELKKHLQLT